MKIIKQRWGFILILIFATLILSRILHPGFFAVHDDTQPSRIYEMTKSIHDGLFPVRWVNDLGFGYGYPIFNFYAPLPYYIGSIFYIIGFGAIASAKIMFSLAVLAAGIGMYLFMKSFLGHLPAIASSLIYLLFPYFAVNIFIRGAVGEYYAYSLLPWIFWGLFEIYYNSKKYHQIHPKNILAKRIPPFYKGGLGGILYFKSILITIVTLSLLIISHNLSAFMLFLILIIFFLVALWLSKNKKVLLINYSIILILSFLLSAFYTIPAITEMNYTDVKSQLSGNFNYSNHFICPFQWWESPWGYAGSAVGCADGISFRLGKTNIIFSVLGILLGIYLILFKKKNKYNFIFLFSIFILSFSLFMMTEYSQFIWQILPQIKFLQFPWRFMNFVGFSMAVIIGFLIFYLGEIKKPLVPFFFVLIIFMTIFQNYKLFTPQKYYNLKDSYYTGIKRLNFTISLITNEYMPAGFIRPVRQSQIPRKPFIIEKGNGTIQITENKTGILTTRIDMKTDGIIHINKAYFPAWKLTINNQLTPLNRSSTGTNFKISRGNHDIALQFEQTTAEYIADLLTISGILALIIGIIIIRKISNNAKKTT